MFFNSIFKSIIFLLTIVTFSSCTKLVDPGPPTTSLTSENTYTTDATAIAVLTGIYSNMSTGSYAFETGYPSISYDCGLSADELTLWNGSTDPNSYQFYQNSLTNQSTTFWGGLYTCLLQINSAIEGLANNSTLTPATQHQLFGEAKFMRAFCYFYLVNLYGDVPLVTGSNYKINASLARTPKVEVWNQILTDLKDAENLLSKTYLDPSLLTTTTERVRPTYWAASALMARTYLLNQNWDSAITETSKIINNSSLYSLDSLNGVFLANSSEAIWQLQPTQIGFNTLDAQVFIIPSSGLDNGHQVFLSPNLLSEFEIDDQRRLDWINSIIISPDTFYFPYKYKIADYGSPLTEYLMIMRLAEQYLIRAEAEAQKNDIPDAVADLNIVRLRAGLPGLSATISQASIIAAIAHERQVEMFTEWGDRWLDLKRTGTVNQIMSIVTPEKGGIWNEDWSLFPLPFYDIQQDPNLKQNPGY